MLQKTIEKNVEKISKLKTIQDGVKNVLESEYEFRYNQMTEQYEYRCRVSRSPFCRIDKRVENTLVMKVLDKGVECFDRDVRRYLYSEYIPLYHPIADFIRSLPKWDGRDRVVELAQRICDDKLWVTVFQRWMRALVAQWMGLNTLHGNSMMPILISPRQGLHKSTFCRILLPPRLRMFYTDDFDISAKSVPTIKLAKFALINIDEVSRMTHTKMERLKNILQYANINICRAYARNFSEMPRIASFIGTANFRELLTDPSGSRRFFPVVLKERIGRLYICYKQLYAQLKEELNKGQRYWFTPSEEQKIIERNKMYNRRPLEESVFYDCFRLPQEGDRAQLLSIGQIFDRLKKKSPSTMRGIKMNKFGEHLAMIGVEKVHSNKGSLYKVCPQCNLSL